MMAQACDPKHWAVESIKTNGLQGLLTCNSFLSTRQPNTTWERKGLFDSQSPSWKKAKARTEGRRSWRNDVY